MTISSYSLRNRVIAISVICFCGILVFGQGLFFDFINYDDLVILVENKEVSKGLSSSGVRWAFTQTGVLNLWAPVTYLSHMLDVSLFGTESAIGHHGVNILLHITATLALYFVLLKLFSNVWIATAVSILWMVHPQRMESVMWVSERKDVLSGAFALWAWWCWEKGRESVVRFKFWLSIATLLFLLASLSKPSVIPLPLVLLVRECLLSGAITKRLILKQMVRLLPMMVVSLVVASVTIYFQQQGGLADTSGFLPFTHRLALVPIGFQWYLSNFLFPYPGHFFNYPPQDIRLLLGGSMAGIVALVLFAKFSFSHSRFVLFGLIVSILFWLPVSGIVPVSYYYVADRYSYLIQIGLFIMLAGFVQWVWVRFLSKNRIFVSVLALIVLSFSLLGYQRAGYWENSKTLFTREMENNPRSLLAPLQLGMWYEETGDIKTALELYQQGSKIDKESGLAFTKQGGVYLKLRKYEDAMDCYLKATKSKRLHKPEPYQRLAIYFAQQGSKGKAIRILIEGEKRFPDSEVIFIQLGSVYHADNSLERALYYYQKALKLAPDNPDALQGKAAILIAKGKAPEGIEILQRLLLKYPERKAVETFLKQAEKD